MSDLDDKKEFEALSVPDEALARGGVELLRVAMSDDKLFLSARPALKDPAEWGEILAELTRRLGVLYDMGDTGFSEQDVIIAIEEAYAAAMGATSVKRKKKPTAKRRSAKRKSAARKPAARKTKQKASKKAPSNAKRKKR
jgi:Domain of unknown function (DUF5076)